MLNFYAKRPTDTPDLPLRALLEYGRLGCVGGIHAMVNYGIGFLDILPLESVVIVAYALRQRVGSVGAYVQ